MVFFYRKIERFARENIVAMWLTQESQPTYRTIARFVVSDTIEIMLKSSFSEFRKYLKKTVLSMRLRLSMVLRSLLTQINIRLFGRKILFAMMI